MNVQCHDCGLAQASTKVGVDYLCSRCVIARGPNLVGQQVSVTADPRVTTVTRGGNTFYAATDGKQFLSRQHAEAHQRTLDARGAAAIPTHTLMGVSFICPRGATVGQYEWDYNLNAWRCTQEMFDHLRAGSPDAAQREIKRLRAAQQAGDTVVQGKVSNNPRRPTPAPRPRKGDLHDLRERTQALVVQIAAMSDKGPIPDGQVAELSKSYAALQAEFDDAMNEVELIKENLSIMRAIMFEHSDPRNSREAIA